MQTLTISVSSSKAMKLIEDLEALNLIKVVSRNQTTQDQKLSEELYGSISDEDAEKMRVELHQMRNEWNRDI